MAKRTAEEVEFLRIFLPRKGVIYVARTLNRGLNAVECKARKIGVKLGKKHERWTPDETRRLVNLLKAGVPLPECAEALYRTYSSCRGRAKYLGLIGEKND
jgi:hypothetical protein